jgi:hypothetical protein
MPTARGWQCFFLGDPCLSFWNIRRPKSREHANGSFSVPPPPPLEALAGTHSIMEAVLNIHL